MKKNLKNKTGFTIIELLAVILILGLLLAIAVPAINKQINSFRNNYYVKLENSVKAAGQDYISDKKFAKPTKLLYTKIISLKDLEDNKYIDEVNDYVGEKCDIDDSYVVVVKTGDKEYEYHTCLKCSHDEYETVIPDGEIDYCDPAWLTNDGIEYKYDTPDGELFYVYYGTEEEKIKEKVGLTYDVVKLNDRSEVIMKVNGDSSNKDKILYPENIGELVGANVNEIIDLKYVLPNDDTLTKKAVIYEHNAPIITTTYEKENVITNKNIGDSYGYGDSEWAGKLKVAIAFSNQDFEEVLNNVKIAGAEYYDSGTGKWIDTNCMVSGRECIWTISSNFNKDVKIRVVNEDGNKGKASSEYSFRVDNVSPNCVSNNGSTKWSKSKTVVQTCSDMLSGCSNDNFSKAYPTATIKNKKTDYIDIYDNAGNRESCFANFYVDSTQPSSCVASVKSNGIDIINGGTATADVIFSVEGTDNEVDASGIKTEAWVIKQGNTSKGTLTSSANLANGTYSITPTCTDNAGNTTEGETKSFILDKKYTVSYDCNGGSGCPSSQIKEFDVNLTLSSTKPTRSNYTFVGWGTSSSDTSKDYDAGSSYTQNSDIKLYAIWKRTLSFTFDSNGASISKTSASCNLYNATKTCDITLPTITRSGFTISGFNSSSSSTSAASGWGSGSSVSVSASTASKWYAITSKTITITFNKNNASSITKTSDKCTIQNSATSCKITSAGITAPTNTPTVLGWNTSASSTSSAWSVNTEKSFDANDTWYAITTKAKVTRTLTYDGNGNTGGSTSSSKCEIAATYNGTKQNSSCNVTLRDNGFTKSGSNFKGWGTSKTSTSVKAKGTTVSLSENKTYYAIWGVDTPGGYPGYTITSSSIYLWRASSSCTTFGATGCETVNKCSSLGVVDKNAKIYLVGRDTENGGSSSIFLYAYLIPSSDGGGGIMNYEGNGTCSVYDKNTKVSVKVDGVTKSLPAVITHNGQNYFLARLVTYCQMEKSCGWVSGTNCIDGSCPYGWVTSWRP